MKILYAVQGTGNGHVSRATELLPVISRYADVDVFLSGANCNLKLPFPVKYQSKGFSFSYTQSGSISNLKTLSQIAPFRLLKEIRELPVKDYDLVVNDFEFISAWSARYHNVPSISLSHQAALLSNRIPRPVSSGIVGRMILSQYAPAPYSVGFHFQNYDDYIFTPVIRREIRRLEPLKKGYFTVYLPAVGDRQLLAVLHELNEVRWEVFSRTALHPYTEKNVSVLPAQNGEFLRSLENCNGLLTSAGFESPAEAMYLKKKLFVIPISGQYEQQCNAAALREMGINTATRFTPEIIPQLSRWIHSYSSIDVHYPDISAQIVETMLFDQQAFFLPALSAG